MQEFIITKEWINSNKTERGAWNKQQINIIGLIWPPKKGWQAKLIGKSISSDNARIFESFKGSTNKKSTGTSKNKKVSEIDKCIEYLFKNANSLNRHQLLDLKSIVSCHRSLKINP